MLCLSGFEIYSRWVPLQNHRSNFRSLKRLKVSGIFRWCFLCDVQFAPLLNIKQWLSVARFTSLSKAVFTFEKDVACVL